MEPLAAKSLIVNLTTQLKGGIELKEKFLEVILFEYIYFWGVLAILVFWHQYATKDRDK